jgi:hypothetical protein
MVFAEPKKANHELRSKKHHIAKETQITKRRMPARLFSLIKINTEKKRATKAVGMWEYNNNPNGI